MNVSRAVGMEHLAALVSYILPFSVHYLREAIVLKNPENSIIKISSNKKAPSWSRKALFASSGNES
jgi:hypothetical protein